MQASHSPFDPVDAQLWRRTIALAEQAIGVSDPNPRVGCILLSPQGQVLGEGATQAAGQAHAEVMALREAKARGHDVAGATAIVSLEPCSHHGRTPPCCDALVEARVARVFCACLDPNPLVAGRGIERLLAAGLRVDLVGGEFEQATRELNIGFFSRMTRKRPWVRMKVAASLDGRTALPDGRSQWITGEPARQDGHAWRRRAGAVLTGIGTVRDDDPRLDVRFVPTQKQPLRVIVDSHLQINPQARILQPPGQALIYTTQPQASAVLNSIGNHIEVAQLASDAKGKNDLSAMLHDLAERSINELHVEAGAKLNASLLSAGLVDELLLYVAPRLLGDGRGIAELGELASLDASLNFKLQDVQRVGDDLRLRLRPR